jgi:hypothetical protein
MCVAAHGGYDRCALIRCSDADVLFLLEPAWSEDSEKQGDPANFPGFGTCTFAPVPPPAPWRNVASTLFGLIYDISSAMAEPGCNIEVAIIRHTRSDRNRRVPCNGCRHQAGRQARDEDANRSARAAVSVAPYLSSPPSVFKECLGNLAQRRHIRIVRPN